MSDDLIISKVYKRLSAYNVKLLTYYNTIDNNLIKSGDKQLTLLANIGIITLNKNKYKNVIN